MKHVRNSYRSYPGGYHRRQLFRQTVVPNDVAGAFHPVDHRVRMGFVGLLTLLSIVLAPSLERSGPFL